eukprot:6195652-Pleurochrysis_carterae.AAC.4
MAVTRGRITTHQRLKCEHTKSHEEEVCLISKAHTQVEAVGPRPSRTSASCSAGTTTSSAAARRARRGRAGLRVPPLRHPRSGQPPHPTSSSARRAAHHIRASCSLHACSCVAHTEAEWRSKCDASFLMPTSKPFFVLRTIQGGKKSSRGRSPFATREPQCCRLFEPSVCSASFAAASKGRMHPCSSRKLHEPVDGCSFSAHVSASVLNYAFRILHAAITHA